jgi:nitrate reductase / nitrite oxidoreductase, alpha subunit
MSHFLDRLTFFNRVDGEFADGHGILTRGGSALRGRLPQTVAARQNRAFPHRANWTGSCSWKIYVKGAFVTWETQQTDCPRTKPDLAQPRTERLLAGADRVKYPLMRSRLIKLWRQARAVRTPQSRHGPSPTCAESRVASKHINALAEKSALHLSRKLRLRR